MTITREAPVQADRRGFVSLELAEAAHQAYARHHEQSMARINERGGFSWAELAYFLYEELLYETGRREEAKALRFYDHVRMGPTR